MSEELTRRGARANSLAVFVLFFIRDARSPLSIADTTPCAAAIRASLPQLGSNTIQHPAPARAVHILVNSEAYTSLLSALNQAVEILERNRTPNPELIATFDTIKQARAMAIRAVERPSLGQISEPEFAAA